MLGYFKIIRPLNLLLILVTQVLIKWVLFSAFNIAFTLQLTEFILLLLATLFIAAGGNIINDIFDVAIDKINKPTKVVVGKTISEKAAYNYYFITTIIGVALGFILCNKIEKPSLTIIFIAIALLLYWYATFLKSMLLIGNLLISILVAASIFIIILFDIYPALNIWDKPTQLLLTKTIFIYAVVALYLNFIREIIKDIQDINGDKNGNRKTLPIVLGIQRTKNIVLVLGFIALFFCFYFIYSTLYHYYFLLFYFTFLILAPLIIFLIKCWEAKNINDFKTLSILLKIIMFLGVITLSFIKPLLFNA